MNLSGALLRRSHHRLGTAYQCIKTSISRRKLLFGSTILFGAAAPTLLSDSFREFALEPHSGNVDSRKTFQEKFGNILRWHRDEPLLYAMIGINIAIYAFWKVNPQFMQKHFLCNLENIKSKRYYVLLTANWSHMDFWHVGLNMYVLYNFGSIVIKTIGIGSFGFIYIGSGILGSIASVSWHVLSKMPHYSSLGASASLLGIIMSFAMYEPNARFKIILSPDSLSFSAYNGIIGLIIFDCLGLILKWRFLDHAAHLIGAITGYLSFNYIKKRYGTSNNMNNLLCINGQYIFEGDFKDYKINNNFGKIYSSTKTYHGQFLLENQFSFHGIGCLRNEINGSVFYGYFKNGYIDGIGLLHWKNGKIFPAKYDEINKDFKIPKHFDPLQLKPLLNDKISVIPLLEKNEKFNNDNNDENEKNKENIDINNNDDETFITDTQINQKL